LKEGEKQWNDFFEDIITLEEEIYGRTPNQIKSTHRSRLIEAWFAAIGSLLAPESDLPEDIIDRFTKSGNFKKIFSQPPVCSRIRELRTRSAVLFFDNYALDELVNLFNPRPKSKWSLWPDNVQSDGKVRHWINQINDRSLCPYWEDIVMQSTLKDASKEKLMDRFDKDGGVR
jgi:hypothetical protein